MNVSKALLDRLALIELKSNQLAGLEARRALRIEPVPCASDLAMLVDAIVRDAQLALATAS